MFKTFNLGLLLGLIGAGVLLWYLPAVDQHRERSLIKVRPNGGLSEVFRINLPRDRILAGFSRAEEAVPAGLDWPQQEIFANSQTELFKLRDRSDTVIGIAGRIASVGGSSEQFIHWMLHLPARGTMFLVFDTVANAEGYRAGSLHAGTREFVEMSGTVIEQFVGNLQEVEFDIDSRIELTTAFVKPLQDDVPVDGETNSEDGG